MANLFQLKKKYFEIDYQVNEFETENLDQYKELEENNYQTLQQINQFYKQLFKKIENELDQYQLLEDYEIDVSQIKHNTCQLIGEKGNWQFSKVYQNYGYILNIKNITLDDIIFNQANSKRQLSQDQKDLHNFQLRLVRLKSKGKDPNQRAGQFLLLHFISIFEFKQKHFQINSDSPYNQKFNQEQYLQQSNIQNQQHNVSSSDQQFFSILNQNQQSSERKQGNQPIFFIYEEQIAEELQERLIKSPETILQKNKLQNRNLNSAQYSNKIEVQSMEYYPQMYNQQHDQIQGKQVSNVLEDILSNITNFHEYIIQKPDYEKNKIYNELALLPTVQMMNLNINEIEDIYQKKQQQQNYKKQFYDFNSNSTFNQNEKEKNNQIELEQNQILKNQMNQQFYQTSVSEDIQSPIQNHQQNTLKSQLPQLQQKINTNFQQNYIDLTKLEENDTKLNKKNFVFQVEQKINLRKEDSVKNQNLFFSFEKPNKSSDQDQDKEKEILKNQIKNYQYQLHKQSLEFAKLQMQLFLAQNPNFKEDSDNIQ